MQPPTLLGYCTEAYLPTRIGMKPGSAEQLKAAARIYDVPLPDLCELKLSRVLAAYSQGRSPSTTNSKRQSDRGQPMLSGPAQGSLLGLKMDRGRAQGGVAAESGGGSGGRRRLVRRR